jgi:hypothetical protein
LDYFGTETRGFSAALGGVAVTLRAVALKEVSAGSQGIGISFHGVPPDASFFGNFVELSIDRRVCLGNLCRRFLLLSGAQRYPKKDDAGAKGNRVGPHRPLPKK